MAAQTTVGHSTTFTGDTIGRTQLELWANSFHAFHDARGKYDQSQFIDVAFGDLVRDQVGTTRTVYEAFGLEWTREVEAAVTAIDQEAKQGKAAPKHSYSLSDYGLSEADINAAFAR